MKAAAITLVMCILITYTLAEKNECYSTSTGPIAHGKTGSVKGTCMGAYCRDNGEISFIECGLIHVPEGCKVQHEDNSKPYPECCARANCLPSQLLHIIS